MERNIRLYPVYQGLWNALFWMPVFFLYFSSILPPARVLQLEAIYYLSVVLLEVPSGYFSDRVGRRVTLIISASCWGGASVVFATGHSFEWLVVGQVLLAAGMAFNSGTDSSLLFDSLASVGRESEYAAHEARGQMVGFCVGAAAALVGGVVAGFELRLAYVLSAVAGLGSVVVALRFVEPPVDRSRVLPPVRQVVDSFRRLRDPVLGWIFVFSVAMTVFDHVPYEFFQPWLDLMLARGNADAGGFRFTPLLAGLLLALTMVAAAVASRRAVALRDRVGTPAALLLMMALQAGVMVAMAAALHPMVMLLIVLRGVPRAIARPVQNAAVLPRMHSGIRATFLSVQSLAGRLAFSGSLMVASLAIPGVQHLTHPDMARLLVGFAVAAGGVGVLLLLTARVFALDDRRRPDDQANTVQRDRT